MTERPTLADRLVPVGPFLAIAWAALLSVQMPMGAQRFENPVALADVLAVPLLLVAAVTAWRRRSEQPWRTPLDGWLLALVSLVCVVATAVVSIRLGAPSRYALVSRDLGLLYLVLVFYALVVVMDSGLRIRRVVGGLILAGSVINAVTVAAYVMQRSSGFPTPLTWASEGQRAVGLMLNPNAYGAFVAVLLVIQLALLLAPREQDGAAFLVLGGINALLLFGGLGLSFSRGGWLAFTAALVVLAFVHAPRRLFWAGMVLAGVVATWAVASGTVAGVWARIPSTVGTRDFTTGDFSSVRGLAWWYASDLQGIGDRFHIVRMGLGFLFAHPLTVVVGIGLDGFRRLSGLYYTIHSTYVWALVELGVAGLVVLTAFFAGVLRLVLRAVRWSVEPRLAVGAAAAVIVMLVWMATAEGLYQRHFWLLCALAVVLERNARRPAGAARPRPSHGGLDDP